MKHNPLRRLRNKKTYSGPGVYIGRPSKWGNPFGHLEKEDAIAAYAEYLPTQPHLMESLEELRGRRLICWCHPSKCHGEVLLRHLYPEEFIEEDE